MSLSLPTRVNRVLAIDPFDGVQRDFESLLGRVTQPNVYPVDVREDTDHLYLEAELPGFKKEELDITLENQKLTITGQRREVAAAENKTVSLLSERRNTPFRRSFTLPQNISEQSVNAKLEDGVLTITLSKREESKPQKIAVN